MTTLPLGGWIPSKKRLIVYRFLEINANYGNKLTKEDKNHKANPKLLSYPERLWLLEPLPSCYGIKRNRRYQLSVLSTRDWLPGKRWSEDGLSVSRRRHLTRLRWFIYPHNRYSNCSSSLSDGQSPTTTGWLPRTVEEIENDLMRPKDFLRWDDQSWTATTRSQFPHAGHSESGVNVEFNQILILAQKFANYFCKCSCGYQLFKSDPAELLSTQCPITAHKEKDGGFF